MLKVATDCSGIGSPEQALKNLNIPHEVVFACEKDKYARQTYLANFEPAQMFDDMTTRDNSNPNLYSDLYIAGIPCQAFSLAGKRLGELDPRGLLFYNFYDYVKQQQPKYFIIENVKGLLSDNSGRTFNTWLELLAETVNNQYLGFPHEDSLMYNLHWTVLNTKDFGIPQNRERVFIIGIRGDLPNKFSFPKGEPLTKKLKDILETNVDEKYYLSEKMMNYFFTRKDNFNAGKLNLKTGEDVASTITRSSSSLDISDNLIVVNDKGKLREVDNVTCIDSNYHKGVDNHAQRTLVIDRHTKKNILVSKETRTDEAKAQRRKNIKSGLGDTNDFRAKQIEFKDQPYMNCLQTNLTNDNLLLELDLSDSVKIRKLTPLECFRLQGFPDSYNKPVSDTQLYRQTGNSITVSVIQAILNNLLK